MCVRWAREKSGKVTWSFDLSAIKFWDRYFGNLADIRVINREKVDEIVHQNLADHRGALPGQQHGEPLRLDPDLHAESGLPGMGLDRAQSEAAELPDHRRPGEVADGGGVAPARG
jgi:hypothetical protein